MRIAIISDPHLGFAYTSQIVNDSFENFEESINYALNCDLILIPGDIFDSRIPRTSVLTRAIKILRKPLFQKAGLKFIETDRKLHKVSDRTLKALPIIALHGNHERRSRGEINIIEALENAGLLIYLNQNYIVFEKNGLKIAIHGMSSVPERYAKNFLNEWNPKPIEGCFNILMLHQSIDPYVFSPIEPPSLRLEDLPKDFDLIIDGHIHIHTLEKFGNSTFLIPGSTITTQMEESEARTEKGFYLIEINGGKKIEFIPLKNNRKFFFEELEIKSSAKREIEGKINEILVKPFLKKPLIKLRIKGKELEIFDQELREIERKYKDKAILIFSKELESMELAKKVEFIRNLIEEKRSIEEIGFNLLRKNLEELKFGESFDYETIFELLSENQIERVLSLLLGEQKTLFHFGVKDD
jgi:DNA repair exonuclease SbcCD nuclease subunit